MGQTSSTPHSSRLLVEHNILKAEYGTLKDSKDIMYKCKLCSAKTNTDVECVSKVSASAHGTRFVYFTIGKAIPLSDYNTIICSLEGTVVSPTVCFETSSFHYDTKIVHKGIDYNQFVTKIQDHKHGRLLARTKKKNSDTEQTILELIDDKSRMWQFVWEIRVTM